MLETIVASSALIVVLTLLRHFFRGKISLRLQYALWLLVAIRLLMPFSIFNSSLSVLNIVDVGGQTARVENPPTTPQYGYGKQIGVNPADMIDGATGGSNDVTDTLGTSPYAGRDNTTNPLGSSNNEASLANALHIAWLAGVGAVGFWFVLQNVLFYVKLRKTRESAEIPNARLPVYLSRHVKSPCLFGFRPAIYLHPDNLADGEALKYILAHEETHCRHGDHLWSYLRCICLALHWFNPLVWWAAVLSRRDCEIACDEGALVRIGDEHRKAYGNTLINMIERRAKPSDLLCGATTMTSGKSGIKERIMMIAKKPKMVLSTLLVLLFALTAIVGCTFTGADNNPKEDVTLYERAGVTIAIPNQYADQLLVDPTLGDSGNYDDESMLIRVYQKSTYDKYQGMGYLFSIVRYTQAQYEQFLTSDGSGQTFFAKDGNYYYGFFFATDVQAPDDHEGFAALFSAVGDYVKSDVIARNHLTAYSDKEFFGRTYTYEGEHVFLSYYPYYGYNGSKEEVWTLILSQPAKQGDAGIWCVERWKDQYGSIYPCFPNEDGTPSSEYYAKRQAESDSGSDTSWLDPREVALAFVKKTFDHSPATLDSFQVSDNAGSPADLFAASTGNIYDYLPDLLAGKTVSDYRLLPCFANFTRATWSELNRKYGSDWFNPLWVAIRDAAVSQRQADSDDQLLRDYYIGKAYLVSDGAYSEGLADIVLMQWNANSGLYSACLKERFSTEEATALRDSIVNWISFFGDENRPFGLDIPGNKPTIYLGAYPIEFPFGFDLVENSRDTHRAESFGQVTSVESDGLQITYLSSDNPDAPVYTVITLRANKERYAAGGVAIGDSEQLLLANWPDKLRELQDGISYDDEAWFGSDYDRAYSYTPKDSTKSLVYLIKDGLVSGIEVVNGLDGAMYQP